MTKIDPGRGNFALTDLMHRGMLALTDESGSIDERSLNLSLKSRTRNAPRRVLQREFQPVEPEAEEAEEEGEGGGPRVAGVRAAEAPQGAADPPGLPVSSAGANRAPVALDTGERPEAQRREESGPQDASPSPWPSRPPGLPSPSPVPLNPGTGPWGEGGGDKLRFSHV